jgi:hypothetical protein
VTLVLVWVPRRGYCIKITTPKVKVVDTPIRYTNPKATLVLISALEVKGECEFWKMWLANGIVLKENWFHNFWG